MFFFGNWCDKGWPWGRESWILFGGWQPGVCVKFSFINFCLSEKASPQVYSIHALEEMRRGKLYRSEEEVVVRIRPWISHTAISRNAHIELCGFSRTCTGWYRLVTWEILGILGVWAQKFYELLAGRLFAMWALVHAPKTGENDSILMNEMPPSVDSGAARNSSSVGFHVDTYIHYPHRSIFPEGRKSIRWRWS